MGLVAPAFAWPDGNAGDRVLEPCWSYAWKCGRHGERELDEAMHVLPPPVRRQSVSLPDPYPCEAEGGCGALAVPG